MIGGPWPGHPVSLAYDFRLEQLRHSHPIATFVDADPTDGDDWIEICRPFMVASRGMVVATMLGWQESRGIKREPA